MFIVVLRSRLAFLIVVVIVMVVVIVTITVAVLQEEYEAAGLTINTNKSAYMLIGKEPQYPLWWVVEISRKLFQVNI